MPIEIKELHIKVTVDAASGGQSGGRASAAGGTAADAGSKDAIVAECVEQVLQILRAKRER